MARHAHGNPATCIPSASRRWLTLLAGIGAFTLNVADAKNPQPPAPCHPNPHIAEDREAVLNRGDVRNLPDPLRNRLAELAARPHSQLPTQAYAEADQPSQLFQYYLLDTNNFEPNPFTSTIAGINDTAMLTATGPDCGLVTLSAFLTVLSLTILRSTGVYPCCCAAAVAGPRIALTRDSGLSVTWMSTLGSSNS